VAPRAARLVPSSVGDLLILVLFRRQVYVCECRARTQLGGSRGTVVCSSVHSHGATVRNICGAFDLAYKQLKDAGQPDVVHEVMIKRIIAAARRGERDVKLLQDAGLTGLRKLNQRAEGLPPNHV